MEFNRIIKTIVVATIFVATTYFIPMDASCGTSGNGVNVACTSDGDCCGSPDNNTYCIALNSNSSSGYCSCQNTGCFCSQNSDCSSNLCVLESGQIYGYCSCGPANNCSCTANDQCGSNYCKIKGSDSSGYCTACSSSTSCSNSTYSCTSSGVCNTVPSGTVTSCVDDYCYISEIACTSQTDCGTGAQCYTPSSGGSSYCQACSTSQAGVSATCTNDGDCCGAPDNNSMCMSNDICSCPDSGCPCDASTNTNTTGQNSSCSSGLCFNNVCSYAPAVDGSCMLASQCSGNVCMITSGATVGTCQQCTADSDCSGSSYGAYCVSGVCIATQPECTTNYQCSSGSCDTTSYTCSACQNSVYGSLFPCTTDGQCCNSICTDSSGDTCTAGASCTCSCAPANGCVCSSNDQCYSNVCKGSTSGIAQICQQCAADSDCSGSSYGSYCAGGICIATQPECTTNSQCSSGICDMTNYVCVNNTTCTDSSTCGTGVCDATTGTCDACQGGGWSCMNDGDCCNDLCITSSGGVCPTGQYCNCSYAPEVGGYCIQDSQCYGNYCLDNACQPCTADSDCAATPASTYGSYCNIDTGMCSPQASECTSNMQCTSGCCQVEDSGVSQCTSCQGISAICLSDGDCCSSYCDSTGYCAYISLGLPCSSNEECGSPQADLSDTNAYSCISTDSDQSTCILFSCDQGICVESIGIDCTDYETVNAQNCLTLDTLSSPCTTTSCPTGAYCNQNTGWCTAQQSECSDNNDCTSGYCQLDTANNSSYCSACQSFNFACLNDGDCCGNYCNQGYCAYTPLGSSCTSNEECGSPAGTYGSGDAPYSCMNDTCIVFSCNNGMCMENVGLNCANNNQDQCTQAAPITSPCTSSSCPTETYCNEDTGWCTVASSQCSDNSYCSSGCCILDTVNDSSYCTNCQSLTYACSNDGDCCSGTYCNNGTCSQYTLTNGYYDLFVQNISFYDASNELISKETVALGNGESLTIPAGTANITCSGYIYQNGAGSNNVQFTLNYYDCADQNLLIQVSGGSVTNNFEGNAILTFYNSQNQVVLTATPMVIWNYVYFLNDLDITSFTIVNNENVDDGCGFWSDVNLGYGYCVNSDCTTGCL